MTCYAPLFISTAAATAGTPLSADIAGSKAAQLWKMCSLGLNVPPAFVLPTTLCGPINRNDPAAVAALSDGLREGIAWLERTLGRKFGDERAPLLVSVRSGAARSMPGMLSTILDVGLYDTTVHGLISLTGNPRLAWDCYRRFIQNYAEVVNDMAPSPFEKALAEMIRAENASTENELDSEALERLAGQFVALATTGGGTDIPNDPFAQLLAASQAVYRSWENPKSVEYRRLNGLTDLTGTAVTIQAMVFGNTGGRSGAGVAFTRNPATGDKELYVDYLADAQGEDVVAGRRSPGDATLLSARLPYVAKELAQGAARLEREFRDVQDIEFTVEDSTLFFLQTRAAKRTPRAALRVLVDLVQEGLIDAKTALARLEEIDMDQARRTRFVATTPPIASAICASPGVASGRVALDIARAQTYASNKEPLILVRHDTSTDDIAGFALSAGILTAVGGRTSHAAVVARQLGKVCLVGCRDLVLDPETQTCEIAGVKVRDGDWISLDGESGNIMLGRLDIVADIPAAELAAIARWRDAVRSDAKDLPAEVDHVDRRANAVPGL